ncbi:hypothetical protein ACLOJK_006582 [Asimina triloba]
MARRLASTVQRLMPKIIPKAFIFPKSPSAAAGDAPWPDPSDPAAPSSIKARHPNVRHPQARLRDHQGQAVRSLLPVCLLNPSATPAENSIHLGSNSMAMNRWASNNPGHFHPIAAVKNMKSTRSADPTASLMATLQATDAAHKQRLTPNQAAILSWMASVETKLGQQASSVSNSPNRRPLHLQSQAVPCPSRTIRQQ